MDARRDALLGAARFAISVRETVVRDFPSCVGTVGGVEVERAAFNVVPGLTRLVLELRAPDDRLLDALEAAILAAARDGAAAAGLELAVEPVGRWAVAEMQPSMRHAVTEAAGRLGLSTLELVSGAGHDAQALAAVTPTGMIFVPSVDGISHDPTEHTHWRDCVNGANVLLAAAVSVAQPT